MDPLAGCDPSDAGDDAEDVEDDPRDEPGTVGWAPLAQPYTSVAMARMTNGVRSRLRSSLVDIEAGAHLELSKVAGPFQAIADNPRVIMLRKYTHCHSK